ncbi:enhancer of polycomb-like protein [Coleophoma cylindrospora]|uniref:Enhancer of polycomb-like protein n=1 Tax=Coleophoma cylindrospora TaxID=1849047 RepID=A0A3D8ST88_9HELO|nr:enhancer of polycomb-like protein [Coleophoma cylindrospora]
MRPQMGRTTRVKKLQPRAPQPILRQDQIESDEYDSLQGQYKVETGVEKSEESEIHLQAALAGTGGDKETEEIPAPPAQESSDFDYDALYSSVYEKPATYIRFSQTVEECTGCQYDMTTEDDAFLKAYNQKKSPNTHLSEDDFEKIMESYEDTAQIQAPFASVDQTQISFDTMRNSLSKQLDSKFQMYAKDIYDHWKARRQDTANRPLQPSLKFETQPDHDDGDPYVCFRRREIRQTRKTRARDVQSTDKLRKLRKELDIGRELIRMTSQREEYKRDLLATEKHIFEQRQKVKEAKNRLNIKGDDDDLINQVPRKRKAMDFNNQARGQQPAPHLRIPSHRSDGRPLDADLETLAEVMARKENIINKELEEKVMKHRQWNDKHIDVTRDPLPPVHGIGNGSTFRSATAQYQLLTPPSSVASDSSDHPSPSKMDIDPPAFRFSSPLDEEETQAQPAYRRRFGRLGRLWIDRRGMTAVNKEPHEIESDRWKYDQDDDDEQPVYEMDPYSTAALRFRSTIPLLSPARRVQQAESQRPGISSSPAAARTVSVSQPAPT